MHEDYVCRLTEMLSRKIAARRGGYVRIDGRQRDLVYLHSCSLPATMEEY